MIYIGRLTKERFNLWLQSQIKRFSNSANDTGIYIAHVFKDTLNKSLNCDDEHIPIEIDLEYAFYVQILEGEIYGEGLD